MTEESRHISVVIPRPAAEVYAFARDPENLVRWAAGLATGVRFDGDDLLTDSPMGEVRVRFAAANPFGVLDHDVTLTDGTVVNNPLRVLVHPDGAEVLFTVRRLGASDADFDRDCATVLADLERLRSVMLAP
ncbi:SRPBCC family protein [Tsukamurella tyrosinosolvens]|uniref:polyketide cyclase n=1 Tax=Tsukamurella tyrosinosolvens TaxID=57704 RepID=UPI000795E490|nr:polyketide cyclase [Tsukamurella tyrosinosolvens]KXP04402.1 polyketide cyclase [Tsukamurella tyrosinosolvens]KZL97641.1 polyketide cyclase [Tsukamurella tyrosinosolvens]MCA4995754.1 SRPBCC family protein [Tsukamurella tyrosinosolvens]WEL91890.1 SRPBCC family protein [Tsukamurella tyrosinosolvens]